jgi:NAD-dependent deacetylase
MRNLVIFTGAGISADSGIRTFRDSDGLWENHSIEQVCTASTWKRNPEVVHAFYNARRLELAKCEPNPAHFMVERLQAKYGAVVLTQNVDDLFEKAGCENVVHLHGRLSDMKCEACGLKFDIGLRAWDYQTERCRCGCRKGVRPGIVMFGDDAPLYSVMYRRIEQLEQTNGVLVVIGTSGQVIPIGEMAADLPGMTILSNLETAKPPLEPYLPYTGDHQFKKVVHGRASEIASTLEEAIIEAMET